MKVINEFRLDKVVERAKEYANERGEPVMIFMNIMGGNYCLTVSTEENAPGPENWRYVGFVES